MRLAKFWARAKGGAEGPDGFMEVEARGWSDESFDAARACAVTVAQRVAARLATDPSERNQYQYGERPLPEPTIREFDRSAVVTRNLYGALVLNVDHLMFVDVDRENALEQIRQVAERNGLSARVYRTAGGFRVMIPQAQYGPDTSETNRLMNEFGSDPLYVKLCKTQNSFRARLTPKPWRCGFRKPPVAFPFDTPQSAMQFQQWQKEYERRSAGFATCHYEVTFGGFRMLPEFEGLIEYHDQETRANAQLPFA